MRETAVPAPRSRLRQAAMDAAIAGLVTLGLGFPLVALRSEQDVRNDLVLQPRWSWWLAAALLVATARLASSLVHDGRRRLLAIAGAWFAAWGSFHLFVGDPAQAGAAIAGLAGGLALVAATIASEGRATATLASGAAAPVGSPHAGHPSVAPGRLRALGTELLSHPLLPLAGIASLALFPLVALALLGPQGSLKWINNYGIQILIYVMLGWGLNIVVGLAGLLDLGYVAFYAVGAYAYALLSTTFGLSFWVCLPLAGLLAVGLGVILGFPVLRLRGDYLAIVTLAFGEIIRLVLTNWTDLSNGPSGISSIPRITFFGIPFVDGEDGFAARFGLEFSPIQRTIFLFWLILALALLTNAITLRLRRLPIGRAWEALREDEIACRSLGIDTVTTKLTAFALGAMFGGVAGAFFAVRQNFVSPESFTFIESATILAIVVLGGMGSQVGVALAAVVMIGGTELLRELDFLKRIFGEGFDPAQYRMLIFGLSMVAMMIWRPRGIVSTRTPTIARGERRAVSGALVKEGHG